MLRYQYVSAEGDRGGRSLASRRRTDLEASGRDPDSARRLLQLREQARLGREQQLAAAGSDRARVEEWWAEVDAMTARSAEHQQQCDELLRQGPPPELLAAARAQVPEDPYGGHRPVWLLGFGVVCLDCDWAVVSVSFYYGSPGSAVAEHRALHLDPPALGLCAWEPMPVWWTYPPQPRRDGAQYPWPVPADQLYRTEDDYVLVCRDCLDGIVREGESFLKPPG